MTVKHVCKICVHCQRPPPHCTRRGWQKQCFGLCGGIEVSSRQLVSINCSHRADVPTEVTVGFQSLGLGVVPGLFENQNRTGNVEIWNPGTCCWFAKLSRLGVTQWRCF